MVQRIACLTPNFFKVSSSSSPRVALWEALRRFVLWLSLKDGQAQALEAAGIVTTAGIAKVGDDRRWPEDPNSKGCNWFDQRRNAGGLGVGKRAAAAVRARGF